jgi:hypothetical protein
MARAALAFILTVAFVAGATKVGIAAYRSIQTQVAFASPAHP